MFGQIPHRLAEKANRNVAAIHTERKKERERERERDRERKRGRGEILIYGSNIINIDMFYNDKNS